MDQVEFKIKRELEGNKSSRVGLALVCGAWSEFEGGEGRACKNYDAPNLSTQPGFCFLLPSCYPIAP